MIIRSSARKISCSENNFRCASYCVHFDFIFAIPTTLEIREDKEAGKEGEAMRSL